MVPSPKLSFIANGKNLTGVCLDPCSTIRFGSLGRLSLSPQEWDSSAIFIGMVHSGSPSLHIALDESSNEDGATSSTWRSSGSLGTSLRVQHVDTD
jgi:hypothetical protein